MTCLSDDAIDAFARGRLSDEERARVEAHVRDCPDCCAVLAAYARWTLDEATGAGQQRPREEETPDAAAPLAPGARLGRYLIVGPLGAGGTGVVYEARDPQLRRRVAIKVLHPPNNGPATAEEARTALLQEAQSLARLSHPNVLAIHDAGIHEHQVFLVLEHVEGQTLAAWLEAGLHPCREVLAKFLEAGRGLAAAHGAGLAHGDFKPENVLIGPDSRARVADFGLAMVTARYVAPERTGGRRPDAQSDQFSFCKSLALALLGEGNTSARVSDEPPAAVMPVLERGLAANPADRHASMAELLAALERAFTTPAPAPSRARARWLAVGATGILVLAGLRLLPKSERRAVVAAGICGDGRRDPGEECDDGNRDNADGCTTLCLKCGGPSDVIGPEGHCYTLFTDQRTWYDARDACDERGGALVTYSHRYELESVHAAFREAPESFWTGMRRENQEEGPLSPDRRPPDPTITGMFSAEGFGPNGCVEHDPTPSDPNKPPLQTTSCEKPHAFMCERAPAAVRAETGHAYRVFHAAKTWSKAEAACRARGGYLATITDPAEHAFIAALVGTYVWIGAEDRENEGVFRWVTGEPFAALARSSDEPNAYSRDQDCMNIGPDGRWHDWVCDGPMLYLCEESAPSK